MAWRTGACAQAGDLPTEGQRQTQAAEHLNLAGSSLHDSSDAGAGTDLRSLTFHQNYTPTVPGETPNRRWSRWKNCCSVATRKSWTPTSRTTSGAFHIPTS